MTTFCVTDIVPSSIKGIKIDFQTGKIWELLLQRKECQEKSDCQEISPQTSTWCADSKHLHGLKLSVHVSFHNLCHGESALEFSVTEVPRGILQMHP
jgi:hypothetical protein